MPQRRHSRRALRPRRTSKGASRRQRRTHRRRRGGNTPSNSMSRSNGTTNDANNSASRTMIHHDNNNGAPPIPCLEATHDQIIDRLFEQIGLPENQRKRQSDLVDQYGPIVDMGTGGFNTTMAMSLNKRCLEAQGDNTPKVLVRTSRLPINDLRTVFKSAMFATSMSNMNIGPKVYDIQYLESNRMVYVMELFDMDLDMFLRKLKQSSLSDASRKQVLDRLATQTRNIIDMMAMTKLLCIDIKPKNAVVRTRQPDFSDLELRFIDLDSDFCTFDKTGTEQEMKVFMYFMFANHLYKIGANYLAEINKSIIAQPGRKDALSNVATQPQHMDQIWHYFKTKNFTIFVDRACSFDEASS